MKKLGEIFLISEKPTEQKITLKGKVGYDNVIEVLDKLCKEITGLEEARCLTQEDIINSKYWEDKKKNDLIFGKNEEFCNWLSSRCVYCNSNGASFGVRYVGSGRVGYSYLWYSSGGSISPACAVRPVVSVKSKINLDAVKDNTKN